MYILGLSGGIRLGYHDIGAALLYDGKLVGAVEEERFNRIKHSPTQLPELSIRSLLDSENITIQDIDIIASHGITWGDVFQKILTDYFEGEFGYCPPIERVNHHDAHAASAYYASGFDEAMILTVDGSGMDCLVIGNYVLEKYMNTLWFSWWGILIVSLKIHI